MNDIASVSGLELQPQDQYGAYYIGELVMRTIQHGLSLDPDDATEAQDKLKYTLIEGIHELYDNQSQGHFVHILEVVWIVDQCFLQGWLTRIHDRLSGQRLSHLQIAVRDGNKICEDSCSNFRVELRDDDIGSLPIVYIDIDTRGTWTIGHVVEMLIHEMVHRYLMLFSCQGGFSHEFGGCSQYSHDKRGRHRHYPRMLIKHVFETIQEWDDTLRFFGEVFIDRCDQDGQYDALVDMGILYM
ncbi:hypothetical protein CSPAE12_07240 [Colletotrichum incanum]|nr:hypothetical protein CSPAE12_07240 [Colletotrichum incanum]